MSEKVMLELLAKINEPKKCRKDDINLPSIITALEYRREHYGLNRQQWATVLGMCQSHYSEFVRGKLGLPKKAMCRAYAVGVPADVLLQIGGVE